MPEQSWNNAGREGVGKGRHDLFQRTVLPHINSAYNLARWLTRNEQDAEDIVQEALLRAFRSFETFIAGRDARAWVLAIVRNCCRTWLKKSRVSEMSMALENDFPAVVGTWSDPEMELVKNANSQMLRNVLEELPVEYREILILRELEEFSYKEIAQIVEIPLGTVMSRLSRARRELQARLSIATGETRP
jgi:RNA polymerase sigma-70 factor (ECF subfamily)